MCYLSHRITNLVSYPEEIVVELLERDLVPPDMPEIRLLVLVTLYEGYSSNQVADAAFELIDYL